ncbi:hypothetical protein BJY21_001090 [Kineosphaera limosa]|uniref:Putative oxidoreductase n=1 Tax=Kineosphaera limosa NBRC 100340 TaxID=1184609 RepID=K6VH75_9MICO|nr:SDR family oxidoreductase [Kineosphaera limosa]NYD99905.1 hypothetical protein [Kineosphaera limosa]GAB95558.1 putative oxidoreductase [Kineosphaera limosa NBRC 100340]
MSTALITGASAGLGAQFANTLAARGHDLVLVARNVEALEALAGQLREAAGVRVEVLPADLADRQALQVVADRVAGDGPPGGAGQVDLLVNNAGFGLRTAFLQSDVADEEKALDVMCRAVLVLSHAAGRAMSQRGHGGILNVASVAAFVPGGSYSAAKAWVTTFTQGLANDLAAHGVLVSAVCPGFTHTEFHQRAQMNMSRLPEFAWLEADQVVDVALRDLARGRAISVPGAPYKALTALLQATPPGLASRATLALGRRRRSRKRAH